MAKDWHLPPWQIMTEPDTDWTKIKWLMRHNFIVELFNKQRARMERRAKRGKAKSGKHR